VRSGLEGRPGPHAKQTTLMLKTKIEKRSCLMGPTLGPNPAKKAEAIEVPKTDSANLEKAS